MIRARRLPCRNPIVIFALLYASGPIRPPWSAGAVFGADQANDPKLSAPRA